MTIDLDDPPFAIDSEETWWRKVRFYQDMPHGYIDAQYYQWQQFYKRRWDEYEHESDHYWCRCQSCKNDMDKYRYGIWFKRR